MTAFLGGNPLSYEGVKPTNPPQVLPALRNPLTTDIGYDIGTIWINTTSNTAWMLGSVVANSATWIATGSGATGGVTTVTGDSGGALSPSAGNINLKGTANQITVTGSGSTETWSIPSAFTAPGSITATTTVTAGTGITSTTGNIVATAGAVNAGTSMTATLGNITATNGNVVMGTAGNKLSIATGANASLGTSAAMTAGAIVISTTAVTASSKIFLSANTLGGTPGTLSAPTASIIAGTSFAIASSSNLDTSTVNWLIIN